MVMNGDSQPKIARLVTTGFLPPNDTDIEPEQCAVAFYYYNLGIPSDVGQMKFILKYDKMLIDMNIFTYILDFENNGQISDKISDSAYAYSYHRKTKQDGGEENEELWSSVDKENLFQNVWTRVSLPISGK